MPPQLACLCSSSGNPLVMRVVKPPKLRRGDVVAIVAPASAPIPPEKIEKGACYLEKLGYRVKLGQNIKAVHGHLAGTDEQRLSDLNAMIRDPQVKAIFAVRGGYGTPRLLPFIDYATLRKQPKIIVGYSDITALQFAIFRKIGLVTFSGPMPGVEFWNEPNSYTEENFWRMVTSSKRVGALENPEGQPLQIRRSGSAEGILLGGNLAMITAILGTPYAPSFRNTVLALEDISEEPYRLDRMLVHLRNAGILKQIKGLLLGHFTDCVPSEPQKPHLRTEEVLNEFMEWVKVPTLGAVQFGHISQKLTLPVGLATRVDANRGSITVLESAVT